MNETLAKQKVSTKKMNANNAKGFNTVKQRLKKNNKEYVTEIEKYRENKEEYMEPDQEEEVVVVERAPRAATRVEDVLIGDDTGFSTVGRGGKALQYTPESILKHLRVVVESRGKKNTDRMEQIRTMEKLLEVATTPYHTIRILLTLISTRFDLSTTSVNNFLSTDQWKLAEREITTLLQTLEENPSYVVTEGAEEWEDDEKMPQLAPGEVLKVPGSIVSLVERLDDELTRSLQHIDPHTAEYIERLSDEQLLYNNIVRALIYVETVSYTHLTLPTSDLV